MTRFKSLQFCCIECNKENVINFALLNYNHDCLLDVTAANVSIANVLSSVL